MPGLRGTTVRTLPADLPDRNRLTARSADLGCVRFRRALADPGRRPLADEREFTRRRQWPNPEVLPGAVARAASSTPTEHRMIRVSLAWRRVQAGATGAVRERDAKAQDL